MWAIQHGLEPCMLSILPQICTKMNGFKFNSSKRFWGGAAPSPLPRPLSPFFLGFRPRFGLRLQFSSALRLRFGLRHQLSTGELGLIGSLQNKFLDPPLCILEKWSDGNVGVKGYGTANRYDGNNVCDF